MTLKYREGHRPFKSGLEYRVGFKSVGVAAYKGLDTHECSPHGKGWRKSWKMSMERHLRCQTLETAEPRLTLPHIE